MAWGFTGAINALHNSRIDAAEIRLDKAVGERSLPIIGGMWSGLKLVGNAVFRPVRMVGGFLLGSEREQPGETRQLPKALADNELGEHLRESFTQEVRIAQAKANSATALVHFDITGWKQHASVAQHVSARRSQITLPEDQGSSALGNLSPIVPDMARRLVERTQA